MIRSRDLDTAQTYDNEGKVLTVKYPDTLGFDINSNYVTLPGATYTYAYDGMSRPITLAVDARELGQQREIRARERAEANGLPGR